MTKASDAPHFFVLPLAGDNGATCGPVVLDVDAAFTHFLFGFLALLWGHSHGVGGDRPAATGEFLSCHLSGRRRQSVLTIRLRCQFEDAFFGDAFVFVLT